MERRIYPLLRDRETMQNVKGMGYGVWGMDWKLEPLCEAVTMVGEVEVTGAESRVIQETLQVLCQVFAMQNELVVMLVCFPLFNALSIYI